jgi:hypothetical protein
MNGQNNSNHNHVLWIEGVDFAETLFDSEKLSIIRGASRTLEEMPPYVSKIVENAFPGFTVIASGASMAGYVVSGTDTQVLQVRSDIDEGLSQTPGDGLKDPPFRHMRFHTAHISCATEEEVPRAIEQARAVIRLAQLREPGVRHDFPATDVKPCPPYDSIRPATEDVVLPSGKSVLSSASAARWRFGRAQRQQMLVANLRDRALVDDFQEMVYKPPNLAGGKPLPISVRNKIAVFMADGDKFTELRNRIKATLNSTPKGLEVFSSALNRRTKELLKHLVEAMEAHEKAGGDAKKAVSIEVLDSTRHRGKRDVNELLKETPLLRIETLMVGGDDTLFVVPAWLGWWLAVNFFTCANGWAIDTKDMKDVGLEGVTPPADAKLLFSAGMVIAPVKTPIRALKAAAWDLMQIAKDSGGGLEIEVLESLEPPAAGIIDYRDRLLGDSWREAEGADRKRKSRLTISRADVSGAFTTIAGLTIDGTDVPFSQLHHALRQARRAGPLSEKAAADKTRATILEGQKRSDGLGSFDLEAPGFLTSAGANSAGLRLYFLLQQRDYIVAGAPWTMESLA